MSDDVRVKFSALTPVTNQAQVVPAINALVANLTPLVGQHKNKNEKAVQWADLLASGLISGLSIDAGGYLVPVLPPPEKPDMTTPPAIANFKVEASFNFVTMSWDQPLYRNHAFVEIWRAAGFKKLPDDSLVPTVLSDAVFRLMTASIVCSDTVLPGDKWRYWARNVSNTGVVGPWTSIDGHLAEVPEDPTYLIDKISGEIREGDLYPALGEKIDASYNGVNEHTQALVVVNNELQAHADSLAQHGQVLAQHTSTISAQGATITQQGSIIASQGDLLTQHTTTLSQHGNSITEQGRILTTHEATLVSHGLSLSTQNAAISDLKTVTEAQDSVLAQHTSQIATANANITSVTQIATNQGQTIASHTNTLSSHGAAIAQNSAINSNQQGLINAAWTVRIDSGNAVSGFGLMVDGASGRSDFIIRADRFAIAAPQAYDRNGKPVVNTAAFPFIVDVTSPASPKVLIKNAYIDQAFIQTLVTGSLVADRITGQTLTGTHIRGGDMAIGSNFSVDSVGSATMLNAFIKGTIQSSNYGAGVSGWRIHNNGNAEFNNAVLRGTIYAEDGYFNGTVRADKILGDVVTAKTVSVAARTVSGTTTTIASASVVGNRQKSATLMVQGLSIIAVAVGGRTSGGNDQDTGAWISGNLEVLNTAGAVVASVPFEVSGSGSGNLGRKFLPVFVSAGFPAGTSAATITVRVASVVAGSGGGGAYARIEIPAQSVVFMLVPQGSQFL